MAKSKETLNKPKQENTSKVTLRIINTKLYQSFVSSSRMWKYPTANATNDAVSTANATNTANTASLTDTTTTDSTYTTPGSA